MHSSVLGQGRHFSYLTLKFLEEHSQASAAENQNVSVIYDVQQATNPFWSNPQSIITINLISSHVLTSHFHKVSWSDLNRGLGSYLETRWLFHIWLVVAVHSPVGICGLLRGGVFSLLYLWNLWAGLLIFPLLAYKIFLLTDKPKINGILLQQSTINTTIMLKWLPQWPH